jgi:anti-sigma regulatory factor (Ser/Thr protein kinase)
MMSEISGASRPAVLRFALPCDLKQIRQAVQTVHQFLDEQGCDEQSLSACDLALVEACNNAIKYAQETYGETPVLVEVLCSEDLIEVRITDHTPGFDWPKRVELPDPESESGRGLYLIQTLMDSAAYFRGVGENILVLRKSCPIAGTNGSGTRSLLVDPVSNHDQEIASALQQSLLVNKLPELPGLELAGFSRSAQNVGGDFYDALRIGDDSGLLVIADVMGKGVLAAMFAAILRAVLRSLPGLTRQPAALLARVNHLLFGQLSSAERFITAQLAFVEANTRRMLVANAGHCPMLVANGSSVRSVSPEGMPLGILPDTVFASEMVELPCHCRVLLYTDGLTEALDTKGECYGQERLSAWFAGVNGNAKELKVELAQKLADFQRKNGLNDDQTFLMMTG